MASLKVSDASDVSDCQTARNPSFTGIRTIIWGFRGELKTLKSAKKEVSSKMSASHFFRKFLMTIAYQESLLVKAPKAVEGI